MAKPNLDIIGCPRCKRTLREMNNVALRTLVEADTHFDLTSKRWDAAAEELDDDDHLQLPLLWVCYCCDEADCSDATALTAEAQQAMCDIAGIDLHANVTWKVITEPQP